MKNTYTPEVLEKIDEGRCSVLSEARGLTEHLLTAWQPTLKSRRASEYLVHGVARRLGILRRCVAHVFEICPQERDGLFSEEEATDLAINLQAFVINLSGVLDNLAWVVLFEATQSEVPTEKRKTVSLRNRTVREHLPKAAIGLLGDEKIERWIGEHMKTFRDALAHRIPLYVPPYRVDPGEASKFEALGEDFREKLRSGDLEGAWRTQDEQTKLGKLHPVYAHSFGDPDASSPVPFHAQVVADLKTIVEIVRAVCPVPFR